MIGCIKAPRMQRIGSQEKMLDFLENFRLGLLKQVKYIF